MDKAMDDQIKQFITNYLNSMPSKSRVTMYDLAAHVHTQTGFNERAAYEIVREVLSNRQDFLIFKGRGSCKQ
jgi:hypothetical protein